MLTIKLPLTREQFEANLNFIHQSVRKALLPAEAHEAITGVLNDLLAGIQPNEEPVKAEAPPKPIQKIKAKEREKAKQQHPKNP